MQGPCLYSFSSIVPLKIVYKINEDLNIILGSSISYLLNMGRAYGDKLPCLFVIFTLEHLVFVPASGLRCAPTEDQSFSCPAVYRVQIGMPLWIAV